MRAALLTFLLALSFALSACSGSPDDIEAEAEAQAEAESVDEADVHALAGGKNSATYQYGSRNAASALACTKDSSNQVCTVMMGTGLTGSVAAKTATWRFTPLSGFTDAEKARVRAAITQLDDALSAWTFVETSAASGALQFASGSVTGSSRSNNIDAFRSVQFTVPNELREGTGVVGNYKSHTGCIIVIDTADINTRAGNATEIGKLTAHAVLNGSMACIGLGTRNDAKSEGTAIDRTVVVPGPSSRPVMTAGDQCRANAYDPFNSTGSYDLITPECAD